MATEAPIACTLTKAGLTDRLADARKLGKVALIAVEVADHRALLRFRGLREAVDQLVAAESECCAFFDFDVKQEGDVVELEILTPEGGEPLLRGLVAGVVAGWGGAMR